MDQFKHKCLDGAKQPNAIAEDLKRLKENFSALVENAKLIAGLHRAKYEELIRLGFSEVQALELCKKIIF